MLFGDKSEQRPKPKPEATEKKPQPGHAPREQKDLPKVEEPKATYKGGQTSADRFEVLNEDDSILVLVDEAHRTQAGDLHANLLAGLPNCARIGFTGTPIIMGEKKRTHEIFGDFIVNYTKPGKRRVDVVFHIPPSKDLGEVLEAMKARLAADKRILKEPAPSFEANALHELYAEGVIRAWVKPTDYVPVKTSIVLGVQKLALAKGAAS